MVVLFDYKYKDKDKFLKKELLVSVQGTRRQLAENYFNILLHTGSLGKKNKWGNIFV